MSRLLISHCFHRVINTSDAIDNNRTLDFIVMKLTEEIGELSAEIIIRDYDTYKDAGKDGVLGEAIDVFIALSDLAYIYGINKEVFDDLFDKYEAHEKVGQKDTFYRLISAHANIVNLIGGQDNLKSMDFSLAIFHVFDIIMDAAEDEKQITSIIDHKLGKWKKTHINA